MKQIVADRLIRQLAESYNTIAAHFSQTRQAPWQEFIELKPFLSSQSHVLDIGCGNGRLLAWLQQVCPTINYLGVDNATSLLTIAQQQFPEHTFLTASMLQLPLPDQQCDIVACVAALQHIPSTHYRLQALQELYRVVKPGGILFMLNWDIYQSKFTTQLAHPPIDCDPGDIFVPWKSDQGKILAERYYHAFTVAELTELCTKTGWQMITCSPSQGGHNIVTIAQHT